MEPICCGWLVKSPPEQKSSGAWKIFGAKWKRRYFVLYAPPLISGIIGTRAAMLEYYSSKKLNTKIGAINLEDCDEVLSSLDSDIYKNVFGLHTKHKGRYRTYYLVADTEEEMNIWVSHLCNVLGLLENDESKFHFPVENRVKSTSCILTKPKPNFTTHPSRKDATSMAMSLSSPSGFSSLSSRLNSSESNLLDSKLFNEDDEKGMKSGSSVPELESIRIVPQAVPSKSRVNMELPPIPPEKSKKSLEDIVSEGAAKSIRAIAPISNLMAEECLGTPPPKPPKERKKNKTFQENYDITKPLTADSQSYDVPKNGFEFCDVVSKNIDEIQSNDLAFYNTPKALSSDGLSENNLRQKPIPMSRKSVVSKNLNQMSAIPQDDFYSSPKSAATVECELYDSNLKSDGNEISLPVDELEPSYDVPNFSSDFQPIVGRKAEKIQKHLVISLDNETYDLPKPATKPVPAKRTHLTSQGSSPPVQKPDVPAKPLINKKSLSMKLSQPRIEENTDILQASTLPNSSSLKGGKSAQRTAAGIVIQDSIRFTQRSKSFKRNLDGSESNEKQTPMKKLNEKEASSDDYDSEDEC